MFRLRKNHSSKAVRKEKKKFNFLEALGSIFIVIVIAVIFRSFVFEPFRIPSSSMYPTLKIGDFVMISKFSYGYSKHSLPFSAPLIKDRIFFTPPQRGDIIVFRIPENPKQFFIKRLIGLPGDKIQVIKGLIYINDQPVQREYIGNLSSSEEYIEYWSHVEQYRETLPNNKDYKTWYIDTMDKSMFPDTTDAYFVPDNYYFFMGDNRDRSVDSRYPNEIGMIHRDNLVGKAVFIHFSTNNIMRSFHKVK